MFVDALGRTGIDRAGIDHLAALEHGEAIRKSEDEGEMRSIPRPRLPPCSRDIVD
jgi:hypothetical protein